MPPKYYGINNKNKKIFGASKAPPIPPKYYRIGYKCVIAQLPSLKRPGSTTTFTTIIKRGESGPIFELTCSDDKNCKLSAKNPSKIWGQLKQTWNELEEQQKTNTTTATATATATTTTTTQHSNSTSKTTSPNTKKKGSGHGISGPAKIGLAHHDIKRLIECLPNALKCQNYKFKYRQDKDMSLSIKKAFKKTLKIKKDKSSDKNHDNKPKKPKKPSPKNNNNNNNLTINNISNINIINNISSVNIINNNNSNNSNISNINRK